MYLLISIHNINEVSPRLCINLLRKCTFMGPGVSSSIFQQDVPWYREETVVKTVKLLMLGKENRSEFWLEQLKMELNFLGSAFLFVKSRVKTFKIGCSQLEATKPNGGLQFPFCFI